MDMATARLAKIDWHSSADRQIWTLREAWCSWRDMQPVKFSDSQPRRVPALAWPANLFDDAITSH
jgi:hypothetical protein